MRSCALALAAIAATLVIASPSTSARYSCLPLPFVPTRVNNAGQVIGYVVEPGPFAAHHMAYTYEDGTDTFIVNAMEGAPTDVNEQGNVVGYVLDRNDWEVESWRSWVYANGALTWLLDDGSVQIAAYGINNSGTIAACLYDYGATNSHVTISNGTVSSLSIPVSNWYYPSGGINDAGWVTGTSVQGGFVWRDGTATTISPEMPFDMNDAGDIVGGLEDAFLWRDGTLTPLGKLPGASTSSARGISNRGQIVGYCDGEYHDSGFLWENGTFGRLDDMIPPYETIVTRANGINDHGWIAAEDASPPGGCLLVPNRIAEFKRFGTGGPVDLRDKTVTAVFPDSLYIEDDDRTAGISVVKPGHSVSVGQNVTVKGTMQTNNARERYVNASTVVADGSGSVAPLGMSNRSLHCGDWSYVPGRDAGQINVTDGRGLNVVGLLIRTTGNVVRVAPEETPAAFYIDDGFARSCTVPGYVGIKVTGEGIALPTLNSHVTITGVCGLYDSSGTALPMVRVRNQQDIQ